MYRMIAHNVIKPDQVKTIYRSQTFPTTGYGYAYNLKPELAARVRDAFFSFPWEGSALLEEFKNTEPPQEKFIPITFKGALGAVVRQIDQALGVSYA
jgi:phosphonate transport system substrate-binding protein